MTAVARFDGTGYFDVSIPTGGSTTWTWRALIQADSSRVGQNSIYYLIGQAGNTSNQFVINDLDSAPATKNCDSRAQSQNLNLSCPNADFISSPTLVEIVSNGSGAELFIDGVSQSTDTNVTTINQVSEYIGRANANISSPFDLYYLEYEEDGVVRNRWTPPADGLGTTMVDSVSGANATANGFVGSPFVTVQTTTIIDTVKGQPTGVSVESSESGIAFTYRNDDPASMQIGSNDGKTLNITFSATGGTGTVAMPSLSTALGFPSFTDATATPAITTFLRATTANGTDDFALTFTPEAPYVVVTMDATALSSSVGNPARIDAKWSTKLVAGDQILLDSTKASITTGGVLNILTIERNFSSTFYLIDSTGLQEFLLQSSSLSSGLLADAGINQSSNEGDIVTLDGTGSQNATTYLWEQISGTTVTINNASSDTATFTAPASTEDLIFRLTVGDGQTTETDTTTVSNTATPPANNPPVADAGANQSVNSGDLVTLDGSGTIDPDSDPLTYSWNQLTGNTVQLSDSTAVQPTFTAPSAFSEQNLIFELTADDGQDTDTDQVTITIAADSPPPPTTGGTAGGIFVDIFE